MAQFEVLLLLHKGDQAISEGITLSFNLFSGYELLRKRNAGMLVEGFGSTHKKSFGLSNQVLNMVFI